MTDFFAEQCLVVMGLDVFNKRVCDLEPFPTSCAFVELDVKFLLLYKPSLVDSKKAQTYFVRTI